MSDSRAKPLAPRCPLPLQPATAAAPQLPYDCLICTAPIYNTNLGIDACRACTVFYRRHLNNPKALLCRKGTNDCYEKITDGRPLCRKCRFTRFGVVLAQSSNSESIQITQRSPPLEGGVDVSSESSAGQSIDNLHDEPDAFLDHRSFSLLSVVSRDSSFFDKMRKAYCLMCVMRRTGEQATEMIAPKREEDRILEGDCMTFNTLMFSTKVANVKIFSDGLLYMFESCFDDFASVSTESKDFILNRSIKLIHALDGLYRTVHHFPDKDVMTPGYGSYIDATSFERFINEISTTTNPDCAVMKKLKLNFIRTIRINRSSYKRVAPTNEEFLALIGLSLWNNELARVNDEYLELVSCNRTDIMSELHRMYRRQGRADYSSRLGDVLCLLNSIEQTAEVVEEDMQVMKLIVDRARMTRTR